MSYVKELLFKKMERTFVHDDWPAMVFICFLFATTKQVTIETKTLSSKFDMESGAVIDRTEEGKNSVVR